MMNEIMLAISRNQLNIGYAKLGFISGCNAQGSAVTVVLQPEQAEAGPMPYCTPWAGKGWGFYAPPVGGEMCLVFFQEGNKNVPIGALVLYWDESRPPTGMQLGEAILKHKSGSFIKFHNDGSVEIKANTAVNVNAVTANVTTTGDAIINATGQANITAATSASVTAPQITLGDGVSVTDALVKLNALQAAFNSHLHSGVQPGGSNSGAPTVPLGAVGTSVIKGA